MALILQKELQLLGIFVAFILCSTQTTYYITPALTTPCPGEPCNTLSWYAEQSFWNFSSNTTLVFLPGDHTLNLTISVGSVSNYTDKSHHNLIKHFYYAHPSLTLLGSPSSLPEVASRIVCTQPAGFTFSGITELHINALSFISCGNDDSAALNIRLVRNSCISNCTFQENEYGLLQSGRHGGAVYVRNSTLTITRSSFQNNTAYWGGALDVWWNSTVTLSKNTFKSNFAKIGGAVNVFKYSALILMENLFQYNSATYGAAIFVRTGCILTLSGNTFQNNSANSYGGAIHADTNNTLNFSNNMFQNNRAKHVGGALLVQTNCTLALSENSFHNNSASHGGAIVIDTNSTTTFFANTFQNNSADYGGAVYVHVNSTLYLAENIFQNNHVEHAGGALLVFINSTLTLTNNSFKSNYAGYRHALNSTLANTFQNNHGNGGAIYVQVNSYVSLSENIFQNNCAGFAGGAIFNVNSTIYLSENLFQNNCANTGGGVVYTNSTSTFSKNTFQNNSANYGGALLIDTDNPCYLLGNIFLKNSGDYGGAIHAGGNSILNLSENIFQNNFAAISGGAIDVNVKSTMNFTENIFRNNSAPYGGAIDVRLNSTICLAENIFQSNSAGYGGAVMVYNYSIAVLSDNMFDKNYARFGGGALAVFTGDTLTLFGNIFQNSSAYHGGAVYVLEDCTLTLSNNTFLNNSAVILGGALAVLINGTLTLSENVLKNNSAGKIGGGALYIRQSALHLVDNDLAGNEAHSSGGAILCLSNSNLSSHGSLRLWNNKAMHGGGIAALECHVQLVGNSLFEDNEAFFGGGLYTDVSEVSGNANFIKNVAKTDGGGIYASRSDFYFEIDFILVGNSALNGGGVLLTDDSKLHLKPNTNISFIDNYAKRTGGAIKVKESNPLSYCVEISCEVFTGSDCFFQIHTERVYDVGINVSDITELQNISIFFENNTALEAGAALYGGAVDSCSLSLINPQLQGLGGFRQYTCPLSGAVFNYISNAEERALDVSSDSLYICACVGGEADCSVLSITKSVYPGGRIEVTVIAYGQRNGSTPAVIHNITPRSEITIDGPENTQNITKGCTLLMYTIQAHAVGTSQEMALYAEGLCPPKERIASSAATNVIKIHTAIQFCPPGFQLSKNPSACNCAQRLLPFTNRCRIEDQKIERITDFWVGYTHDNTSDGLILHRHCPFDYCTLKEMYVAVEDGNSQCSNNRIGLLCGKCSHNFSLILGSSHCLQCSNTSLWLVVVFAFSGIGLVLLLLVLRLTVAVGTINGLVFYANILAVNSATFFQPQTTNVLTVFIAWLNLDLGIKTCFYNGMDAYAKSWLQFSFPFYLWCLVGVIIIVSHYSSRVATILGTNPIAVLATLLLLSYAKLLRTIIAALSYTLLEYPNNSQMAVWLYDGNIRYLSNKHIPLFIAALLCLIVLFLPYTVFLILSQ